MPVLGCGPAEAEGQAAGPGADISPEVSYFQASRHILQEAGAWVKVLE